LSAEGAEAIPIPTIRIAPIADTPELETALAELTGREWLAFTSPAGVEVFFGKLKAYRRDVRTLAGVKFAAVGKATASALEARGVFVDVLPERFGGAELGAELAKAARPGERVILPRSSAAGEDILRVLSEAGVETAAIAIYDTLPLDRYRDSAYRELLLERLDWLAFTSSSGVEGFAGAFGPSALKNRKALCIGGQTAQAAARYGMEICAAKNATLESMTETFKDFLKVFKV
jgi:uroporphyrinogen III methyltransferase/synthase